MATPLGTLTEAGIEAFRNYLAHLREGGASPSPRHLLADGQFSEPVGRGAEVEERSFADREEAARYLAGVLEPFPHAGEDAGLWAWLSLFYFDQVCPPGPGGRRRPGRDYRHLLELDYRHAHRHLLAGPYRVWLAHGERARLLLATRLDVENNFHHELASRQAFISSPSVIEAAGLLYLDPASGKPKRGAQRGRSTPGSLRRFVDLVQQLEVNYDLHSMIPAAILELLPAEFDRWKENGG